ncbi:MAG: DUF1232 domain-containing protein [Anaerolineae bacterium]
MATDRRRTLYESAAALLAADQPRLLVDVRPLAAIGGRVEVTPARWASTRSLRCWPPPPPTRRRHRCWRARRRPRRRRRTSVRSSGGRDGRRRDARHADGDAVAVLDLHAGRAGPLEECTMTPLPDVRQHRLRDLAANGQKAWRLMLDRRVPAWQKAIPIAAALYAISPIDLVPEALLGLGIADDLVIVVLALRAFNHLAGLHAIDPASADESDGPTIEVPYRVD